MRGGPEAVAAGDVHPNEHRCWECSSSRCKQFGPLDNPSLLKGKPIINSYCWQRQQRRHVASRAVLVATCHHKLASAVSKTFGDAVHGVHIWLALCICATPAPQHGDVIYNKINDIKSYILLITSPVLQSETMFSDSFVECPTPRYLAGQCRLAAISCY